MPEPCFALVSSSFLPSQPVFLSLLPALPALPCPASKLQLKGVHYPCKTGGDASEMAYGLVEPVTWSTASDSKRTF